MQTDERTNHSRSAFGVREKEIYKYKIRSHHHILEESRRERSRWIDRITFQIDVPPTISMHHQIHIPEKRDYTFSQINKYPITALGESCRVSRWVFGNNCGILCIQELVNKHKAHANDKLYHLGGVLCGVYIPKTLFRSYIRIFESSGGFAIRIGW